MPRRSATHRFILASAMAVSVLFGGAVTDRAVASVRMSWQDFAQDPNRVAAFRKAVAAMKARNSADHSSIDYRKSWEY
ncbi:hypothetical protein [Methylorubrum sp. SB2]|uniref:hypothetical protein n=1 Tax=Methylorubrum subtropicum TaxID=3138812 RepID=UPI00313E2C66